LDELWAELWAQAELLSRNGIPISHIDYHNHKVVLYTPFYRVVRHLAKKLCVPVRQPVPGSITGYIKFQGGSGAVDAVREMMTFAVRHPVTTMRLMPHMTPAAYKKEAARLKDEGIGAPDVFIDGYFGRATVEQFAGMVRQLPPGVSELAVHPASIEDRLRS